MQKNTNSKTNTTKAKWLRGLYMLVALLGGGIAIGLAAVIMLYQFLSTLIMDKHNENLLGFAKSLGVYCNQIMDYLTYNTEDKPYPFDAWPTEASKRKVADLAHAARK